MIKPDDPSVLIRFSGFLIFLLFTVCAFLWFFFDTFSLYKQISANAAVVNFSNGGFYSFGGAIALSTLTYGILQEVILRKPLSEKVTKIITRGSIAGIALMIVLPQFVNYTVDNLMESSSYMICEKASTRWLMYKHIAYVSSDKVCLDLIAKREKMLSEPLF